MRILLLYDNFIRDFRGLLLLQSFLEKMNHRVWIHASWNQPLEFAKCMSVDMIVGGQIAEASTHHIGKFAKENNIRFVLNSTENVAVPAKFDLFVTYNTSEFNDEIIDLQTIAATDVYQFVQNNAKIKSANKVKYKNLGFPRLDITTSTTFRNLESENFRAKYGLKNKGKVYLFISSFLLDGAYDGIPQRDLDRWNFTQLKTMTDELLSITTDILSRLVNEILDKDDVLLIKKHPWDCSNFFAANFSSSKVKILDNSDYIVPCLVCSDVVIHTYSTAAVEAWILDKQTISILPKIYQSSYAMNHMKNEQYASSFDEFKALIENYPNENPSKKTLEIFAPNLDGLATYRLAVEINKIKPNPNKTKFSMPIYRKIKTVLRMWLLDHGFFKIKVESYARPNSKMFDFLSWENQRANVIKIYKKTFDSFAASKL
jgi:surface carbohydrate biosynthesis protein